MVEIGNKIRELRVTKKMTQKELAETLNVTPQTISKWERNKSYPDLDTLIKLSHYFNVSTDTLLGNIKQPFLASLFSKKEKNIMKKEATNLTENGKTEATLSKEQRSKPMTIFIFGITNLMAEYEFYTALLVTKMINIAKKRHFNLQIEAFSSSKLNKKGPEADIILLCPELGYEKKRIQMDFPNIPVGVINKKDYGLLHAEHVLADALALKK